MELFCFPPTCGENVYPGHPLFRFLENSFSFCRVSFESGGGDSFKEVYFVFVGLVVE